MPPRTLHGLDRDVYQIVRKFEDDHERENSSKPLRFTVSGVYDWIKRSNSSLARLKKRPLEDSIERVLRLRKEERLEDDEEAALDDATTPVENSKERDYFLMNKQLAKAWEVPRRGKTPSTPDGAAAATTTPTTELNGAETRPAEDPLASQPKAKRRKVERSAKEDRSPPTGLSFDDLGGMDHAIRVLGESVTFPMKCPEACIGLGLEAARGVLLHGPPGCGKTMLANALAAELGVAYIPVSAPSLIAGMSGESEKKIRELYEEAKQLAPCLIFIDEIDAIMGKRENAQREMEKRIVAQMLTCMDDLTYEKTGGKAVVTLAATNRPDSIDPALRRAGRFNREISLGIPNEPARESILQKLLQKSRVSDDLDYKQLARSTPGFVGADLEDVVSVAKNDVARRIMDEMTWNTPSDMDIDTDSNKASETVRWHRRIAAGFTDPIPTEKYVITMELMLGAIKKVQPAAKREGFTTIPDTNWTHIGALRDVREQLMLSIVKPIQSPESFAAVGLEAPSGVLLWGPPGCGKTLLAKAVANESRANFIAVKGPELLNKYVGESERAVRQVFGRARASAPCVLFFDELDALVPRRDGGGPGGADASARVVNQLLTELDGVGGRDGVYVVGATNRPDMLDPAILRPGRLGTNIFVDLPDADGRADILRTRMRRLLPRYARHDLLDGVARDARCEGFSGADLDNLHVAAGQAAVKRAELLQERQAAGGAGGAVVAGTPNTITEEDWEAALSQITPSVSKEHARKFRRLKKMGWE